jgi:hypothetical protein
VAFPAVSVALAAPAFSALSAFSYLVISFFGSL